MWILSKVFVNSLCSQEQEVGFLADICLVGEPSAPWKSNLTAPQSSRKGKMTDSSRRFPYGMTFARLTGIRGEESLTLSREVFPAKTSALPEKAQESTENVADCGENLRELSVRFDPDTSSWKIAHSLLSEDLPESSVTLPKQGMMRRGRCWELTMLAHRTDENAFGFSEKFLTPQASDAKRSEMKMESLRKRYIKHPQGNLAEQIAMFPTPRTKGMCGGTGNMEQMKKLQARGVITDEERKKMTAGNGGALNPDWVEWLMAFPIGWTDLKPLATHKFLSWRRQLSNSFSNN